MIYESSCFGVLKTFRELWFERIYLNVIDSFPDGKYHIINYSNNNI